MDKSNKYEIPKDWFTSEEAQKRREKIKESSDKMLQQLRNSQNINGLLSLRIGPKNNFC